MKRNLAIVGICVAIVGWFEDPAHSKTAGEKTVDLLAMAYVADRVCPNLVGALEGTFNELMVRFTLDYNLRQSEAVELVALRAVTIAAHLKQTGKVTEFCWNMENGRF